jgi:hypothetical protein
MTRMSVGCGTGEPHHGALEAPGMLRHGQCRDERQVPILVV